MFVIVLLVVFSVCIATGGGNVKVNFTSSHDPPNIAEGKTVVFNCSSNHSALFISWSLNKTVSASTLTSLGVIVNGASTPASSLTIPGLVDPFNDTEVLCFASGPSFGNLSPPPVMLRVQGVPALVDNLKLSDSCCYMLSWTSPFTLPGFPILSYTVNVTNNGVMINQTNVSVTQWNYCPQETGTHIISIAAVNEVGEGIVKYHKFEEESEIRDTKPMDRYIDNYQNQIISLKLYENEKLSAKLKNCTIELIELKCTDNSTMIFNSSNITNDGLVIFNISAVDKSHNVTTHITLDSGLVVNSDSSNPLSLSFFDVSDYEVLSRVSTNVSFECTFLKGSKAVGCCIIMKKITIGRNYSLNITRENITATGHVEDAVESGSYNVSIYDINFDGNQASEPAYYTTIDVTSHSSTPSASPSPAVISITTSPTSMLSTTPSPTTGEASNGNNGVIAIVIGTIFGVICFGIILIMLAAFVCWRHKAHSKKVEIGASEDVSNAELKNTVNYVDVEWRDSNAPANPPPLEISKTVYSTIRPVNNQPQLDDEECSRSNHASIQELSQGPSDYSTLEGQQDQTGSMLYDTVTDRQQPTQVTVPSQYSVVSKEHM